MDDTPAKRRLTTIFCADVAGYGSHVSRDEEGTVDRWKRLRAAMRECFRRREGVEINSWGDAVIARFDSPVEAVRCAVEVQEAADTANRGCHGDECLRLRIGINLGDVLVDGDNVFGEGVNAAARLEAAAAPGGVLVSNTVHDLVHRQLAIGFDRAEPVRVKDGEEPVEGYSVRIDRSNAPPPGTNETRPIANPAATGNKRILSRTAYATDTLDRWLIMQSKTVRVSAGMILFFFLINAFFSGLSTPWFIFPSMPFFITILAKIRSGKTGDEDREAEERFVSHVLKHGEPPDETAQHEPPERA